MQSITVALFLFISPLIAQQTPTASNPLAQLKDQVKQALEEARLPFSSEQENAIVLMMEDRRKASEDLFGDLMNFQAGPTQGQEADRLRSAIQWMETEFLNRLQDHLTPDQFAAWSRAREAAIAAATTREQAPARQQNQTQYVRINNNAFTGEDNGYRLFNRASDRVNTAATEVIQRGGVGAWHGNIEFLLKDDALNAGRRFAQNKPPYQERQTTVNVSGPVIPDRLTTAIIFSQNEAKNSDTIRATLPDSIFSLGVTKPTTNRSLTLNNTFQVSDATALSFNGGYTQIIRRNQGVGAFVLPERAYTNDGTNWNFEVRQFTSLSAQSLFESRFKVSGNRDAIIPANDSVQINVLDAFNGGGSQNKVENTGREYEFSNLYSRLGEKMTLKTGYRAVYRKNAAVNESNFGGIYTFSSLDAYLQDRPINYRVTRGNTSLETTQFEMSIFAQNDVRITPRLTLMYGARYEIQTNLRDRNNIDPRLSLAYAVGPATVIRAGAGTFHQRLLLGITESVRRLSGTHQYEVIIDNPSFPDPFQSGSQRPTFPSVRVTDPDLATPYSLVTLASVERTFFSNLFLSVQWDRIREVHRPRLRNINAPMDITSVTPSSCEPGQSAATCVRPIPSRGNILQLESSASETAKNFRLNYRQRFSIFTVSANYTNASTWLDANLSGQFGAAAGGYGPDGLNSDQYNLAADWGRIFAPIHSWSSTVNARLPLGVFLTGTMNGNAHRHYNITTGRDDNQDTSPNDRPAGKMRNGEIAPMFLAFDFNVSKAIFFGSAPAQGATRTNVNVFANMTNAFNRPNYNAPSGVMTSPNFGKYTSAGNPREIEVGLRFQF